jgi:uncharacterized protein (TIGR00725 family)
MSAIFRLDRDGGALFDAAGRRFDAAARRWSAAPGGAPGHCQSVDVVAAVTWLQRDSGHRLRQPIGVIGPRDATASQMRVALEIGERLARSGFVVVCGGRHGVMQAVCEGVAKGDGLSIGLLPDADPAPANPFVGVILATGIGEARNALIARAAFCLIAIGDSFGTLSEVALGRRFGKQVIGLAGAANVAGVVHVPSAQAAHEQVAGLVLALDGAPTT